MALKNKMKVELVPNKNFQSLGGLNFIPKVLKDIEFNEMVEKILGKRDFRSSFSYSEVLYTLFCMNLISGERLDDIRHLGAQLDKKNALFNFCSPDTVEYVFKMLAHENKLDITDKGIVHYFNEHPKLNSLLFNLVLKSDLILNSKFITLDFDGHPNLNNKPDSAYNYKNQKSYYPVFISIFKLVIAMQNRNGNTPEKYKALEFIKQCFLNCEKNKIEVDYFRADASCYQKEIVEYLENKNIIYFIRMNNSKELISALEKQLKWEKEILKDKVLELCKINYEVFGKMRQIVAYRELRKSTSEKKGENLLIPDFEEYSYHVIITNDKEKTAAECEDFYRQRGCFGEHHFKELDYDFNMNKLPFDNMAMNTIYMYSCCINHILFNIVKEKLNAQIHCEKPVCLALKTRLKGFILGFLSVVTKWIKKSGRLILKVFSNEKFYEKLELG